jgi:penicillin-binding protein 1C
MIIFSKIFFALLSDIRKDIKPLIVLSVSALVWIAFIFTFFGLLRPSKLFDDPYSLVLLDRNGEFLGARIATDGQWRFPKTQYLDDKYIICLTEFEDKRFFYHPGIDPLAFARSFHLNLKHSKKVSGGSTITMQTIRLSRKNKPRTYFEKLVEVIYAVRMEISHSKDEILKLYASHAPFGGNIVGIEAASWRYFGRSPENLSWAENAMLAVLPNSPALIHTGKNRELLKTKRDALLKRLLNKGHISLEEYELAILEEIPEHPHPYPMHAYHLISGISSDINNNGNTAKIKSSIDINLQQQVNQITQRFNNNYRQNNINNIAAIVIDIDSGEIIAYVGNAGFASNAEAKDVDMVTAMRSTGSILKPILYTAMLSEGLMMPRSILVDIPTRISGYMPENFDMQYDGAVNADEALTRSLNIPFVRMLQSYGIGKFIHILNNVGLQKIDKSADHYGLSLILGGAEASLLDITNAYASMARSLKYYNANNSRYHAYSYVPASYYKDNYKNRQDIDKPTDFLSASAIWYCLNTLTGIKRPEAESRWQYFSSKQKIAWKTGTSFGLKDAWTVGVTPDYAVGVWVGNATGEGRPGIVGVRIAAPVFFEIINILPSYKKWFDTPYDDMVKTSVCRISGHIAGDYCHLSDSLYIPKNCVNTELCPYHQLFHLDNSGRFRVNADCYPVSQMQKRSYFVLPPAMEYFYVLNNPGYSKAPEYMQGCKELSENRSKEIMEIIYPENLSNILIPVDISGDTLKVIFKAKHRNPDAEIFWHINENYYGSTKIFHEISVMLPEGEFKLSLVDNEGNLSSRNFKIVGK